jgi:hypothetical protein
LANKTRSTFQKRQKEVARQARRKDKQAKRLDAKQKKAEADADPAAATEAEDPYLVGIALGPQIPLDDDADGDGDAESHGGI